MIARVTMPLGAVERELLTEIVARGAAAQADVDRAARDFRAAAAALAASRGLRPVDVFDLTADGASLTIGVAVPSSSESSV